jgi:hypothetical protein
MKLCHYGSDRFPLLLIQKVHVCVSVDPPKEKRVVYLEVLFGTMVSSWSDSFLVSETQIWRKVLVLSTPIFSIIQLMLLVTLEIATYSWPREKIGAGHAFPKQQHKRRGWGEVIYFCQGFLPCMMPSMDGWMGHVMPSMDGWRDRWIDGKSFTTTTSFTICDNRWTSCLIWHFQNLFIYHIPHVFLETLAIENLDVCTACDPWDNNIQLTMVKD